MAPVNEHLNGAQVIFSTPVSSQKIPRASVLKSTRFQLPSSDEKSHHKNNNSAICTTRYINVSDLKWTFSYLSRTHVIYGFLFSFCLSLLVLLAGACNVANQFSTHDRNAKTKTNTIPHTKVCSTQSGCIEWTHFGHTWLSKPRTFTLVSVESVLSPLITFPKTYQ